MDLISKENNLYKGLEIFRMIPIYNIEDAIMGSRNLNSLHKGGKL